MIGTRSWRAVLAGSACALVASGVAVAQIRRFDVPPGDLKAALDAYVRQSGTQLIYPSQSVRGKTTPGVQGTLSAETALDRLLAGTGFVATRDPSGAVVVTQPSAGAVQPAPVPPRTTDVREVVVTGTQIAGFDAPIPVTMLSGDDLRANAARNVADLVGDIPQLRQRRNIGQTLIPVGLAQIDLRGLNGTDSAQRTLVMIDGRRVGPTAPNGWIDANIIPASLLTRVEVVTGGASAAYGSDAVAGVVNFILDRNYEGFKGDLSYGESKYGDNRQPAVSLTYGRAFADDRAHLTVSADYYSDSGALSQSQRDWGREGWCANTLTRNGVPYQFFRENCRYSQITAGGVTAINAPAAIADIQFGPGGTIVPFNRGADVGSQFMTGGDGILFDTQSIAIKTRRKSGFASFTYDFSDDLQFFADAIYSEVRIFADSVPQNDTPNLTTAPLISQDNAYLPTALRALMVANNIASFRLGRYYAEQGSTESSHGTDNGRYSIGFKGDLGEDWSWEAYATVARNTYFSRHGNSRNNAKFAESMDAVISPLTGQPICRSSLTDPGNGCVPSNPFGPNSLSQAAIAYWEGVSAQDVEQKQDVAAVTVRGAPFELPAGPVGFAAGVEARRDEIERVGDPISQVNGWKSSNFGSFAGEVKVKEAFGELAVPLVADQPGVEWLDVNFAGRVTDYSTSGTVETWKAGANYAPVDWLRFRGTVSRDIRAPTIYELFRPVSNASIVTVTDFVTGGSQQVFQRTGGNPDLTPEIARTHTAGVVFSPAFLPGFRASIDYYKINISDVVGTLSAQQTIDRCRDGDRAVCALIVRGANNNIDLIIGANLNADELRTSGVDTEILYRVPANDVLPWDGDVVLRVLATYTQYRIINVAGVDTDIAGQNNNGIPTWKINTSVTYNNGPLTFRASVRYMSDGKYNKILQEGRQIEENNMKGFTYLDLAASYQLSKHLQVHGAVNNLFNVDPVLSPSPLVEVGYSGGGNYDLIGQWASVGVRFNF